MQKKLAILAILALSTGLVSSAYAHKSEVVGNYKIEVGWKNEPPIVGKKNAIEIIVTKATASDKKSSHDHSSTDTKKKSTSDKKSSHNHSSTDTKKKLTTTKTFYEETHQSITLVSTKDKEHKHDAKECPCPKKQDGHDAAKDKEHKHDAKKTKATGITGLSKTLEASVTLNDKKTFLKLVEDKKNKGTYYGEYTPESEGFPTVHVVGKIKNTPVEITFHPEKVVKR